MKKCCKQKTKWKRIPGFAPYYRVSNKGDIKSKAHTTIGRTGRTQFCLDQNLKLRCSDQRGHLVVNLQDNVGTICYCYVHRLVLLAFMGPPKPGQECRHLDGNPTHNCISNLRWGTHQENMTDKKRHGTVPCGMRHGGHKLTNKEVYTILTRVDAGEPAAKLSKQYKVNPGVIHNICKGISWRKVYKKWVKAHERAPHRVNHSYKLTDKEVFTLLTKVDAGEPVVALAAFYKITPTLISTICGGYNRKQVYKKWVKIHGRSPIRTNAAHKLTLEAIKDIHQRYSQGVEVSILAKKYSVDTSTIYRHLRKSY